MFVFAFLLAVNWSCALAQDVHYVAQSGQTPVDPYTSWTTAASNIQDAVDAAVDGDTVLVTNGLYETGGRYSEEGAITNRVVVEQAVTVQSVNGPAVTVIRGQIADDPSATRCAYLNNGAILAGFTLTNGGAYFDSFGENSIGGGGFFNEDGEITRCLILDNTALNGGGVVLGPVIMRDCLVCGNTATDPKGAGAFLPQLHRQARAAIMSQEYRWFIGCSQSS